MDPASLRIVKYPHPVLKQVARPVAAITPEVKAVAARMVELMKHARGVGLAAPQVGLDWRLFVVQEPHAEGEPEHAPEVFINPELTVLNPKKEPYEEGCLSLPYIRIEVERPMHLKIRAMDLEGRWFEKESAGFPARIWQHENDHLDGKLITDRMSPLERRLNAKKLRELEDAWARGIHVPTAGE